MRTVFTNAQCAHVWAQQTQEHGRGASVKFQGDTFYSYDTPIARIVQNAHGERVCLLTSTRYSMTTEGKHKHHATRAVNLAVFIVPDLFPDGGSLYGRGRDPFPAHAERDHAGNVGHYLSEYTKEKAALMRCPSDSYRVRDLDAGDGASVPTRAHQTLAAAANVFSDYSDHFALGLKAPDWQADAAEVIARRDRLASDPKAQAKRAARAAAAEALKAKQRAAAAERDRVEREKAAETVKAWRAGADVFLPWAAQRDENGGALLRVRGDIVQTSMGAEVPARHVRRVLEFYQLAPRPWQRDAQGAAPSDTLLGHFRLDSIDVHGNVRAGCHFVTAAEVAALRATLNA